MARLDFLDAELAGLQRDGLLRTLRRVGSAAGPVLEVDGRRVVSFAANNYLGLADHPALVEAAAAAAAGWGTGAGASRLIVGNLGEHEDLEREVAAFHGTEAALLFNSGYHANIGVIGALAERDDLVVSDELNHASLIDGCRLARARVAVFRHGDAGHAAELLKGPGRRRFLVTESVFSMDGDVAPLRELAEVAQLAGAALVVDEAHAVGALGPAGRGLVAAAGVEADVLIGTFGKAFGSFGGYVAGSARLRSWLVNRARTFVFTTGLPAPVVAASRASLAVVAGPEGDRRRAALQEIIGGLAAGLSALGHQSPGGVLTPILPLVLGEEVRTMAATEALLDRGIYVQGIRPPTVPRGTSRLRIGAMATHTLGQVKQLLAALADTLRQA
jgi:8-amino-7-oxononanoate synthase